MKFLKTAMVVWLILVVVGQQAYAAVTLILPPVIYAVVGQEANIFFDTVVTATPGNAYVCKVHCSKGRQQSERWVFTPGAEDVGSFPLKIEVRDGNDKVVAQGESEVLVASPDRLKARNTTLLAIGDSLTEAGIYTEELITPARMADGPRISLIGTHHSSGSPENVHEGYGGWKYEYFLSRFDPASDAKGGRKGSSPFVFDVAGKPVFDLPRYFREKVAGASPDVVTIFLGTNDVFAANDETRKKVVDEIVAQAEQLVSELRKCLPKAKIGILAPVAPAGQDAFGENYGCEFDAWTYRKNQTFLAQGLMEAFAGKAGQGIYFVPSFVNFDATRDYPVASSPRNARNSEMIERQTNALHPTEQGYRHIADAIFAWLANVF